MVEDGQEEIAENTSTMIDEERLKEVSDFFEQQGIVASRKRKRNLAQLNPAAFLSYKFGIVIANCCKEMDLNQAYQAFLDARAQNIVPNADTFANLLNLTAGLGEQGSSLGPPRTIDPPSNIDAAFDVFHAMKIANAKFSESSYTALIRCCSVNGKAEDALKLYEEMKELSLVPKLRTFHPLLSVFAEAGNFDVCSRLFEELLAFKLEPTEREYVCMLKVCVATKNNSFYAYFDSMREDVLVPTKESWRPIENWFQGCTAGYTVTVSTVNDMGTVCVNGDQLISIDLDESTRQALSKQVECLAIENQDAVVSERSMIGVTEEADTIVGDPQRCYDKEITPSSQEKRQHSEIENCSSKNDHPGVAASVPPDSPKSRKKRPKKTAKLELRVEKWSEYKTWLSELGADQRFDVVVDGANVGYYKQNFAGAPLHVDYRQIDWMLHLLVHMGRSPLLVLHCRHLNPATLPPEFAPLVAKWQEARQLYVAPAGCNDDWYWLNTAVTLKIPVVTNDEMRDHHFQMLSPRWFSRWKERNQIHFSFGGWETKPLLEAGTTESSSTWRRPQLQIPLPYSRRIQRLTVENSLETDSKTINSEKDRFYVPCVESDEWLCIYCPVEV